MIVNAKRDEGYATTGDDVVQKQHDLTRVKRTMTDAKSRTRDTTLDTLRAIAIFFMIQGNIGQSIFSAPIPRWLAVYIAGGSFVPALFLVIVGMTVFYTAIFKQYTLRHYLIRTGTLFITAAILIDVLVWGLVPFVGVDVLYIIGLSLPVSYLFRRLSARWRWLCVVAIFVSTPFLQRVLGYDIQPTAISIFGENNVYNQFRAIPILKHWLIDGWFPIVPWLGFALLGVNFGILRWQKKALATFATRNVAVAGGLITAIGLVMWWMYDGPLYSRSGFQEIFYPPTLAYIVTVTGQIMVLASFVDWKPDLWLYKPLRAYGESALFLYWTHHILIKYLKPVETISALFATLGAGLVVSLAMAYALQRIRRRWPNRPALLRYVLGI